MSVLVKICGITTAEDARQAAEGGADFLGFIRAEQSPRFVTAERMAAIARDLPAHVQTVGVFVNAGLETIRHSVSQAGLDRIQLHGDEPETFARALGLERVWRVVHLDANTDLDPLWRCPYEALVADTAVQGARGGSGVVGDWAMAAKLAAGKRTVLAGGLHAENVVEAIRRVRPWCVDVSSGVESNPGIKDPARLRRFIRNARKA